MMSGENKASVNIDQILTFWSLHNTTIIESLIVVILALVMILAYLSFFGSSDADSSSDGGVSLSGRDLSQVLNTVLQAQSAMGSMAGAGAAGMRVSDSSAGGGFPQSTEAPSGSPTTGSPDISGYIHEIERSKVELANREKTIEDLKIQIKKAQEEVGAATAKAAATPPAGEITDDVKRKMADLEQRLAEYEIISEDIADLSKYKEENSRLTEELEKLRRGVIGAAASPPLAASNGGSSLAASDSPLAVIPNPVSQAAPAPDAGIQASSPVAADLIGDDLMKEFEAAVASQKGGALKS